MENNLIRVTEVLRCYQDSYVIQGSLAEEVYFKRGSDIHLFCANYAKKIWTPINDEYMGYCLSFKNWFDSMVAQVLFVEERLDDLGFGFTGKPDLGCIFKGSEEGVLIDYKTSATTQKWYKGQTAAYLHLAQKKYPQIKRAGSLMLNSDGGAARFIPCDVPAEALAAFLSALNGYRYFKKV